MPDSVLSKPVVQAARKLHGTISRANRFGIWSWGVNYRYGIIPELDGQVLAENLTKLADVPAQLVYAASADARNSREFSQSYDYRHLITREFPMNQSRTAGRISTIFGSFDEGAQLARTLIDTVNIAKDDMRDPRSVSYRLAATSARMVGIQNKLAELIAIGFGAFENQLEMTVRNVSLGGRQDEAEWAPLSPMLMDFTALVPALSGINVLEVRWMGHPPKPVVGSAEPFYRIDCSTTGPWPSGQNTWKDSTGNGGPSYFVDLAASRVFAQGAELCKWARQPDIRALNIRADKEDRRFAGLPVVDVPPEFLRPPPQKLPR
jgi:hypothetical protein